MQEDIVKDAINAFYKGAGIKRTFSGAVNQRVLQRFLAL